MPTSTYMWSLIGQTANPMVAEKDALKIGNKYFFKDENQVRAGTRLDLLNIKDKVVRSRVIKLILENQTASKRHSYVMLDSDPRFDNGESVPFPAVAASRPIITDDVNYRTTGLSSAAPYLIRAFNQMVPYEDPEKDCYYEWKYDLHKTKVGSGYLSASFFLGKIT